MIRENAWQYPVSAMCRLLQISRSTYYYQTAAHQNDSHLEACIHEIFEQSRGIYGARKIKFELAKVSIIASRRKIRHIMSQLNLVSKYTTLKYRSMPKEVNHERVQNKLNREFNDQPAYAVSVSDLTYVRVGKQWHYICFILDLFNREIIGYSAGRHKDANLVCQAFAQISVNLNHLCLFHTDRGSEFKNHAIDQILETFHIKRSLSRAGCPYDNAVAESTFKIFKTEFVNGRCFESLAQLQLELSDYVHWYNACRIHGALGYLTPIHYRTLYSAESERKCS